MKTVLIVGKKFSSLTEYLSSHGMEYVFLQDVRTTKFPDKKFKRRVLADFSTKETILEAVDKLKIPPDAVVATYEDYILPTAWIAEHLGLPGLPVAAAEACTDKYIMRSMFREAPEKISPDFIEVGNEAELVEFARNHSFPLILKPANLSKSLLVTKSRDMEELVGNYRRTMDNIERVYKKYAPNRKPKLVLEEFLEGSIHSVDAFVDKEGMSHVMEQIVDYQTGYDIGYDDNFHYSRILPSKLSPEAQVDFLHCAEIGCRALGMRNSPAHIEIIVTKDGPRIVEIGARNGGYRERMHWLANGIDITGNMLRLAFGDKPKIIATKNESIAVLELFPKTPGFFAGIKNEEELRSLLSLNYLSIKTKIGDFIGKSSDGYKMAVVVILHNSDSKQFLRDLDFVNNSVEVATS